MSLLQDRNVYQTLFFYPIEHASWNWEQEVPTYLWKTTLGILTYRPYDKKLNQSDLSLTFHVEKMYLDSSTSQKMVFSSNYQIEKDRHILPIEKIVTNTKPFNSNQAARKI